MNQPTDLDAGDRCLVIAGEFEGHLAFVRCVDNAQRLVTIVVGVGDYWVDREAVASVPIEHLVTEYCDVEKESVPQSVLDLVPWHTCHHHSVLPISDDDSQVLFAAAEPDNLDLQALLEFTVQKRVRLVLAPRVGIWKCVRRLYREQMETEFKRGRRFSSIQYAT